MPKDLSDLKVCIFDVFGTVVDWRGSLIEDLPKLGKKYGLETDWTSFADDWRGLYQPQMSPRAQGRAALDAHRRPAQGGVRDAAEEARPEASRRGRRRGSSPISGTSSGRGPIPVEGIGMMKKKFVVATLSNGNVALLINMAKNSGIPWDHCFSGETFKHYKPDPESYLGVVDSMYLKPHQVMLCAAHNGDLAAAQKCGLSTGFVIRPNEHGPGQKRDLKPEGDWDAVGNDMIELAKKIGA